KLTRRSVITSRCVRGRCQKYRRMRGSTPSPSIRHRGSGRLQLALAVPDQTAPDGPGRTWRKVPVD
ncbi:MAG TPA: hypothetical protein VGK53_00715, partial [Propionicimonas sp.]